MRARDARHRLAAVALAAALGAGCAATLAPPGFLPDARHVGRNGRGGWFTADVEPAGAGGRGTPVRVRGELLAVGRDSVYVLADGAAVAIESARIRAAQVAMYEPDTGPVAAWTVAGLALSAGTHGFGMVISVPAWILGGTIAAASVAGDAILRYPREPLYRFGEAARFPQGLPGDLGRAALP